ncbi:hypothetical protein D1AOALGA4SA_6184 [Olavius algarvensis Delta 1 endosymbiont]|nr:hypothetical protein D1AOALGA4SA_6184 [Olavius algarvensis Delta 1 endosymbiont]
MATVKALFFCPAIFLTFPLQVTQKITDILSAKVTLKLGFTITD